MLWPIRFALPTPRGRFLSGGGETGYEGLSFSPAWGAYALFHSTNTELFALVIDREVPSTVLSHGVARLVLDTGGDGSRVGSAVFQRSRRGKGGHLGAYVVMDIAINWLDVVLIKKLEGGGVDGGAVHVFGKGDSRMGFGRNIRGAILWVGRRYLRPLRGIASYGAAC